MLLQAWLHAYLAIDEPLHASINPSSMHVGLHVECLSTSQGSTQAHTTLHADPKPSLRLQPCSFGILPKRSLCSHPL